MTLTNSYASLDDYKAWIAIRGLSGSIGTDTSDDGSIEISLEAASRYFDRETGRRFYPDASDTVYYFQANDDGLHVDLPDFASIATVSVDYSGTRTYTDLAGTDWEALPDNYVAEGLPILGLAIAPLSTHYFPEYSRGVKVTGKRGRLTTPTDVKEVVLSIAQNLNGSRSGQNSAGNITVTGAGVVIRPSDVPAFAQKIIAHYRNML